MDRRCSSRSGLSSNDAETWRSAGCPRRFSTRSCHGIGALFGSEERRADVLEFNPDGSGFRIYATGLRNCVGMAINPTTGDLWCSTNERDGMGDNLPPDYITHVRDGGFYGWPWYYIGNHEDPHHKGQRPDLAEQGYRSRRSGSGAFRVARDDLLRWSSVSR